MTGRTAELERIREVLASDSPALVLAGAPGTGKTRLALECLRLAEEQGMYGARVVGTRTASGIPLGALAPLLPASQHHDPGGVGGLADLLRRSAQSLAERAGDRRLALVVDDAHLLDDTSATLIHQLVTTRAALVVATLRCRESAPDAIQALWKDEGVERLEIGGLRTDAIEELLRAVLGGPIDAAAVRALSVGSRGNVLFLRELTTAALEERVLRDDGGIWRLVGPVPLSNRLVEIIEHRLQHLSDTERRLLEVLSLGEPLGLVEFGDEGMAERLERAGLLSARSNGRRLEIWLSHPLYGQVLHDRIPALRARSIARTLAEAVEATGARRREDVLRVASWRLEGGGAKPDLMFEAATMARWRYDFPLAERLARAALSAGAGFDAALLAARLGILQGRCADAERELAGLARRASTDRERALVAITRLENNAYYRVLGDDALQVAEEAEPVITDPGWRDEITARRSAVLGERYGPRAALELAEPLWARARGGALVWAAIVLEYSYGRMGQFDAVTRAASYGKRVHRELSERLDWYPWLHDFFCCEALVFAGSLSEAESLARRRYEEGVADGSTEAQGFFALALARTLTERGLVQTAAMHAREAVALFRSLGRLIFVREGLSRLTMALALAGDARGARQALSELDALRLPTSMAYGTDLVQARAWATIAGDDLPAGRRLLEEAAGLSGDIGDRVGEAAALHGLARSGQAKQATARLVAVVSDIEGAMAPLRAAHCRALGAADPEALEEVSSAFADIGANLLAAEAASDAAAAWNRTGRGRRMAAAQRQATMLMDHCENPRTPALLAPATRSALTRAERDAALLAAGGHSNKRIAGKLHLSVRTIEAQLQRVYGKLGIGSRTELRDALGTDAAAEASDERRPLRPPDTPPAAR